MSEPAAYFRRNQFHGEYAASEPKWHASANGLPPEYGEAVALCGYTHWNLLGTLKMKVGAAPGNLCARCKRKMTPATSVS